MPGKNAPKRLTVSSNKIANVADLLLGEDGHEWELEELHLVPKGGNIDDRVVCKWEKINGKWVLVCKK